MEGDAHGCLAVVSAVLLWGRRMEQCVLRVMVHVPLGTAGETGEENQWMDLRDIRRSRPFP